MIKLKDDDYRVRIYIASAITVFFDIFEDEEGIYKDVYKNIPSNSPRLLNLFSFIEPDSKIGEGLKLTSLMTLAEIACRSPKNEKTIVMQLCTYAIQPPGNK